MRNRALLFLLATFCLLSGTRGQPSRPLVLTQTIIFPKVQGGFNHMSVDAVHQRLFAAAPTNKTVEVVDLKSGKPWRSLEGERPAAARYAPEFNQLYVSSGQSVRIYNGETLDLIASIDLESRLDELQYDLRAKELYVGCMTEGKTGIAVIAIPEGKLLGKITLPERPQGIGVELTRSLIFANLPSRGQVAVIDRKKRAILHSWPVRRVRGNTPLALDEAHNRLFLGGREPPRLVVLDSLAGKAIAEVPINDFADDLFWDPGRHRIYISCGEGFIDVVEQQDADHYRLMGRVTTADGAATSTFSDQLNSLYVGVPRRGDQPAEILVFKAGR